MNQDSVDWDLRKDLMNQLKHGVSFTQAQDAFFDNSRVIAEDIAHSDAERRFYCFGKVRDAILTVRFTYRGGTIRIIGAGFWRRGERMYERKNEVHR